MRPPSRERRSSGAIALVISQVPRTLTAITRSQVSMSISSKVLPPMPVAIAALFTRPSIWAYCALTLAANASIELGIAEIDRKEDGLRARAPQRIGRGLAPLRLHVGHDDRVGFCRGTGLGKGATEPAPGAGDQDGATLQAHAASRARAGR